MSAQRIKEYLMQLLPDGVGGEKRYRAYFVSDGFSVDGNEEILPVVIEKEGIKVSSAVAKSLFTEYLKACVRHTAITGETVNIAGVLTVTLTIRGSYEQRKSSAPKKNVRVSVRLLEELRPDVSFAMVNALAGKVLRLQSVTSEGCDNGYVRQGKEATINGLNMTMLEGDTVTATMKDENKVEVSILCTFHCLGSTRMDVTIPAEFNREFYADKEIVFKVTNRCGDADAPQDSDTIRAVLLRRSESDPSPAPTPAPDITGGYSVGHDDDPGMFIEGCGFVLEGTNLNGATFAFGPTEGGVTPATVPADKVEVTDTEATIDQEWLDGQITNFDIGDEDTVIFTATNSAGSDTYQATFRVG